MNDDLVKRLKIMARDIEMWEKLAWGSDSALMREAAARIEELSNCVAVLEAKLAKAVKALKIDPWFIGYGGWKKHVKDTLAELNYDERSEKKGQDDD